MEIIAEFTVTDLVVLVLLAGGVLIGFTQGTLRYILSSVAVLVAFVVAGVLKGPIADALVAVWRAATPDLQELWIFLVLFVGGIIGGWVLVRTFYRQTRLPLYRVLDEIGGAVMGVLFVVLVISLFLVTLDTYFAPLDEPAIESIGVLGPLYLFLNDSVIVGWFREFVIPIVGFALRPFVPDDMDQYLDR
ncbi:MAG: CvpA family protein [Candidatus Limnocylindria bacterium]